MFAEQAFDVKHLVPLGRARPRVVPPRQDRAMALPARSPASASTRAPALAALEPTPAAGLSSSKLGLTPVVRSPAPVHGVAHVARPPVAAAAVGSAPAVGLAAAGLDPLSAVRLPAAVYRRRRALVAMVAALAVTALLVVGRAGQVPPGEANPWPARGEVTLPADLPAVYVVQPGDTLWDIARAAAPGADPRLLVQELAEAAGGATLEPGQEIVIDAAATAMLAHGWPVQQDAVEAAGTHTGAPG